MNRWNAPTISGRALAQSRGMTMGEGLHGAEREIWEEAQTAGRAAGLAAAQRQYEQKLREVDELCRSLQSALDMLSRPLAQVDDEVFSQVAQLAVAVARGIVRRELRTDPTQVIGIVRIAACQCAQCARCAASRRCGAGTSAPAGKRTRSGLEHLRRPGAGTGRLPRTD
jgi:Flagellar assembly protein FliH